MSDKAITSTTQEFLDVYDIVNDMVLLKDGSASIILHIGTMNFSLLAEQEQDAVIFTYGSLLNSLNYPIQINIQSQTKDATKYLRLLDEQAQKASSDRKAALIRQYRGFVESLIKERNVLQKRFYIITAASPTEMGILAPSSVLPGKTTFSAASVEKSILLEKAANILDPRREHLIAQFNRLGLFARQLTTQEIIQNFYINYNPEAAEGQEISSSENYTTPLVRASFGGKTMPLNNLMQNTNQTQGDPLMNTQTTSPIAQQAQPILDTSIANENPQGVTSSLPSIETPVQSPEIMSETLAPQEPVIASPSMMTVEAPLEPGVASIPTPAPEVAQAQAPSEADLQQAINQTLAMNQTVSPEIAQETPLQATPELTGAQTAPVLETPAAINLSLDSNLLGQQSVQTSSIDVSMNMPTTPAEIPVAPLATEPTQAPIEPVDQVADVVAQTPPPTPEVDFGEEIPSLQANA